METNYEMTDYKNIPGWGSDLDVEMRPGYPMWKRPEEGTGAHWKIPEAQELKFKEFHSIERPGMTSVFGTSVAPKGLSGLIRQFAFKYSEGSWGHWLPLLLADRINVVEGIFDDLLHGHIPNVYKEMGGPAERKYNPQGFQKKVFVAGLFLIALPVFFAFRNKDEKKALQ